MLITLRSKGASWAVKILFGLLIISFGFWGIPDVYQRFQSEPVAASVGDTDITLDELRKAVDFRVRGLQRQSGGQLQPEMLRQFGVVEGTLDGLIQSRLLEAYATELEMAVPDDVLERALKANPRLRGPDGNLDAQKLETMFREFGLTEAEFAAVSRRDILGNDIVRAIAAGAQAPKSLTEAIYRYRAEQRVAQTLVIPDSSIADVPPPDDAALARFHKDNEARYQAPEYRALTVVRLTPEDYAKQIAVGDDAVRAEYDARKSEFDIPEKRLIVQAVLPDEAAAKDMVAKVDAGTPFVDAVKSATGADPVEIGTFTQSELQARLSNVLGAAAGDGKLSDALFAASLGQATTPVQGPIGWHVLSPSRVDPPSLQPFDSVRDRLKQELALRQAADDLVELANQLDDEMGAGASLPEAAEKLGLAVAKIAAVDATGKAPDGTEIVELKGEAETLKAAYETTAGDDSPLIDARDGGFVILHVDGVQPAATKALETIRATVLADWQAEERKKAADVRAQAIVERLERGESIGKIAHDLGLPVLVSQPFTRDGAEAESAISGALAAKLFAAQTGAAAADRAPADNASVVAVLTEIKPVDLTQSAEQVDALQKELAQGIGGDLYEQLNANLEDTIGVSRDQDSIDQLYK